MTSAAAICNLALVPLKRATITSLSDGTEPANDCLAVYSETRDRLLRSSDWNFAQKRQKLAQLATTPVSGFDYAYQLPSDLLTIRGVFDNDAETGRVAYRQQGQTILCDAVEVWLVYTYALTDEALMPPDFRAYFAADIESQIAKSNTDREQAIAKMKRLELKARSVDAIEDDTKAIPDDSWITERNL